MEKPLAVRSHEQMKDVLMDPSADGPAAHYYMIRGGSSKGNVTVWEPGTVGGEYVKSYGHYHVGRLDETYRILAGEGYILMQVRKTGADGSPIDAEIGSFKAVRVKAGDSVFIPSGAGHLAVNTGRTWLVTEDDSPVDFSEKDPAGSPGHADYRPFKSLRGAAYYVIEKDGKPEFVRNPRYADVPPLEHQV
ncbi:MAG TPA: glucose-6-phosphate isomerase family protein [Candidatus Paceibacterota bacterium]|nr:glucose-6-phosphate isomerase family protein [Candidatus Paceibacterota bacterium]